MTPWDDLFRPVTTPTSTDPTAPDQLDRADGRGPAPLGGRKVGGRIVGGRIVGGRIVDGRIVGGSTAGAG